MSEPQGVLDIARVATGEPDQVRAWMERHGLTERPSLAAEDILNARDADHAEAHEWAAYVQLHAWVKRHDLRSGRREHVNVAIGLDFEAARDMNESGEWRS